VHNLRFDDYLLADARRPAGGSVNLYAAYYDNQTSGRSAHSPKTCIPGGGWEITSIRNLAIDAAGPDGVLTVGALLV
jgi:EpsI family protein